MHNDLPGDEVACDSTVRRYRRHLHPSLARGDSLQKMALLNLSGSRQTSFL